MTTFRTSRAWRVVLALVLLAIVALLVGIRVAQTSQGAHAAPAAYKSACTYIAAVTGSFYASPRVYKIVCATFIPPEPTFDAGNNCDYVLEDIPGIHLAYECVYAGGHGHYIYSATGARVWASISCVYYADETGTIVSCEIQSPLWQDD